MYNTNNTIFRIGDYVDVQANFSNGFNRLAGCGFVERLDGDLMTVKYTPEYDSGRRHNKIPTSKVVPANLHQAMMVGTEKRNRGKEDEIRECEVEIEVDKRTISEKLLGFLTDNNHRKSGWHRRDLRLNLGLEENAGVTSSVQLNKLEKTQLYAEYEILRTYHSLTGSGKHKLKGRSSKFKKRTTKHNYHSLSFLVE